MFSHIISSSLISGNQSSYFHVWTLYSWNISQRDCACPCLHRQLESWSKRLSWAHDSEHKPLQGCGSVTDRLVGSPEIDLNYIKRTSGSNCLFSWMLLLYHLLASHVINMLLMLTWYTFHTKWALTKCIPKAWMHKHSLIRFEWTCSHYIHTRRHTYTHTQTLNTGDMSQSVGLWSPVGEGTVCSQEDGYTTIAVRMTEVDAGGRSEDRCSLVFHSMPALSRIKINPSNVTQWNQGIFRDLHGLRQLTLSYPFFFCSYTWVC